MDAHDSLAAPELGTLQERRDAAELYIDNTVARVIDSLDLRGMRIILDCANGAVTEVAPAIFGNLGADIYCINAEPDGRTSDLNSGALHPNAVAQTVKNLDAAVGFSFDGDGDRVIPVDENGVERDGDYVMAIAGRYLKEKGRLPSNTVVTTVMANFGLEKALKEREIEMVRTNVGDREVMEELLRRNAVLGGEQSGHILLLDQAPTGDGIWTALMVLQIMRETGKPLSELVAGMPKYPQTMHNIPVKSKPPLDSVPEVSRALEEVNARLGDTGRVVLRYSGTEPLARVMVEGPDHDTIEEMARSIADAIRSNLG